MVGAAGNILVVCAEDPDFPVLFNNAEPVLAAVITAVRAAPSSPGGLIIVRLRVGSLDYALEGG
jgi:hypothetical protein